VCLFTCVYGYTCGYECVFIVCIHCVYVCMSECQLKHCSNYPPLFLSGAAVFKKHRFFLVYSQTTWFATKMTRNSNRVQCLFQFGSHVLVDISLEKSTNFIFKNSDRVQKVKKQVYRHAIPWGQLVDFSTGILAPYFFMTDFREGFMRTFFLFFILQSIPPRVTRI